MSLAAAPSTGLWIAMLGPDGAGKSAVIDELEHQLAAQFDGVSRFHFRPRFCTHAPARPAVTQPHAQPPRSRLVSALKLLYWFADCWYGYLVAIRPRRRGSGLIIFDRYLPDILVDPLRYRLPAPCLPIAQRLCRAAPHPDLYILLDAPPEIVHARKPELPIAELYRQRIAYLNMFSDLRCRLIVDVTGTVHQAARNIVAAIRGIQTSPLGPSRESLIALNT